MEGSVSFINDRVVVVKSPGLMERDAADAAAAANGKQSRAKTANLVYS